MSGSGKSMRDALAGKELIGFKKSSEQIARSSSAKVSIIKHSKKYSLQRASTTKVDIVKAPEHAVGGTEKPTSGDRA